MSTWFPAIFHLKDLSLPDLGGFLTIRRPSLTIIEQETERSGKKQSLACLSMSPDNLGKCLTLAQSSQTQQIFQI